MSTAELQAIVAANAQTIADLRKSQSETDRQMKETDRQMKERQAETDSQMKATDRKIKELSRLFTTQWGKLVEALMEPGCVKLFRERGIAVARACTNQEWFRDDGSKVAEVDVFLVNGGEDVAVEVKTTCQPKDIDEHIERLAKIKSLRPEYRDGSKKLYAAVAALKYSAQADDYAWRKGFYVLKSSDGIVTIENEKEFIPVAH